MGRMQRDAYLRELDTRFAWLARHPMTGRKRDEIALGYRSYPHQAMDLPGYFDPMEG